MYFPRVFPDKAQNKNVFTIYEQKKLKILLSGARGGANYRVIIVMSFFNFESARGAKYREYGTKYFGLAMKTIIEVYAL